MGKKDTALAKKGIPDDELLAQDVSAKMDTPAPDVPADTPAPTPPIGNETQSRVSDQGGLPPQEPRASSPAPAPSPYTPSAQNTVNATANSAVSNLYAGIPQNQAAPTPQPAPLPASPVSAKDAMERAAANAQVWSATEQAKQTAEVGATVNRAEDKTKAGSIPQMPIGFDATKWNDPNYNSPKYEGSRIIARGGSTQDVVNALGAGWTVVDGQRIRDPQGRVIDLIYGFDQGMHQAQWNVEGGDDSSHDTTKAASSSSQTAIPGQTQGVAGQGGQSPDALIANLLNSVSPGAGAQSAEAGGANSFNTQIRQSILNRLSQVQGGADINDPAIRSRLSAYQAASQAALSRGQSKFAEQAYAQGLPAGAQDANLQGAVQNSASDEGRYAGDLMGQQLESNKAELEQLLQLGSGLLTADESRQIQAQIAAINAQLQQQSLGQSNAHFYDQLGADIGNNEALLNDRVMSYLNA